ncbi:glutamate--cysteine ligase [Corallococcus sp. H22C18031201]|uniref:glutamate--cysteine ligase n=1 Tax=Citreicoccus inhibens TaxID=2849499 RepID=UPI000E729BFE|nr:glutamate-cysteine ligase family protein [Citreicoccus inhibens]MBU8896011.1 glutamate--cysteine ligase [Citreicoccus inhibens]RJS25886.1 glutamate--cysteine ligase [Corallococcus sp. H22C18031201]
MSLDLKRATSEPITSVDMLVDGFRSAEKPRSEHRLGLEHEKFVYPAASAQPVPYEGASGIGALLGRMEPAGYQPFRETPESPVIALQRGMAAISLEPGGQLELSGSPFRTAREAHAENLGHLAEAKAAAESLGLRLVALGYRPTGTTAEMPWMPKTRYLVMRRTLPERGRLALNMMLMTSTGQVSLDWADEADCVRKTVTVARLAPLLVALYANSPLLEGKPSGYMSFRSRVWEEVDPTRCGYLPSWFDGSFSYKAYVDWAIDAPLLFLRRNGQYLYPKLTFRQLMKEGFEGQPPDLGDWTDHLSTLFPEVRLKKVLEVRGADCASAAMTGALGALWRGILYDATALEEAGNLLPKLTFAQHQAFHDTARREGLEGKLGAQSLSALAAEMVAIAKRGLERLDPADAPLLAPLAEVAASGRSPARAVLDAWTQDPRPETLLSRFVL